MPETQVAIGKTTLSLHLGDITLLEVDAIVNAANNRGWMGGGVAAAIRQRGGREIEEEAVARGPWPVGEAIVTRAGKLKARYVIHAATMKMDFRTDEKKIRDATRNSLLRANELGLRSIAFPALGAGVGGLPLASAARTMIDEAVRYARTPTSVVQVVFALYENKAYRAFEEELGKVADET